MDKADTYKTEELISLPQIAVEANSPNFLIFECDILNYIIVKVFYLSNKPNYDLFISMMTYGNWII